MGFSVDRRLGYLDPGLKGAQRRAVVPQALLVQGNRAGKDCIAQFSELLQRKIPQVGKDGLKLLRQGDLRMIRVKGMSSLLASGPKQSVPSRPRHDQTPRWVSRISH